MCHFHHISNDVSCLAAFFNGYESLIWIRKNLINCKNYKIKGKLYNNEKKSKKTSEKQQKLNKNKAYIKVYKWPYCVKNKKQTNKHKKNP